MTERTILRDRSPFRDRAFTILLIVDQPEALPWPLVSNHIIYNFRQHRFIQISFIHCWITKHIYRASYKYVKNEKKEIKYAIEQVSFHLISVSVVVKLVFFVCCLTPVRWPMVPAMVSVLMRRLPSSLLMWEQRRRQERCITFLLVWDFFHL